VTSAPPQLAVRGGTVVDGTGRPGRRADILVHEGRIVEIGEGIRAPVELDASGAVVAPGFIDIHTHYDAQVLWDPRLTPSGDHGVTTVVAGNCGFSVAPVREEDHEVMFRTLEHVEDMSPATLRAGVDWASFETFSEYLHAVRRAGVALNFGAYIGHTALRMWAMGSEAAYSRRATATELESMQQEVRDALSAGALGVSTSFSSSHRGDRGRPVPSRIGDVDELTALARPLRAADTGVLTVQIGELVTIQDLCRLYDAIRRPITWCSLLVRPGAPHRTLLEATTAARDAGYELWAQTHTTPVSFLQSLAAPFLFSRYEAFSSLLGGDAEARRSAYCDRTWRARAMEQMRADPPDWSAVAISESTHHARLNGMSVEAAAETMGVTPVDVLCDVSLDDDFVTRFRTIVANREPAEVASLLRTDGVLVGLADSGAHVSQICEAGFASDFLGTWVRERQLMPLEQAVFKMTGEPAAIFGLTGRGTIAPGAWADLCVFDPRTVGPGPVRRVHDLPGGEDRLLADRPQGIRHVLVNGVPIRRDEAALEDPTLLPGRVLGQPVHQR
jgi:N-acyl-D-amino-acid deacylase